MLEMTNNNRGIRKEEDCELRWKRMGDVRDDEKVYEKV
jgi:hypothetical protein